VNHVVFTVLMYIPSLPQTASTERVSRQTKTSNTLKPHFLRENLIFIYSAFENSYSDVSQCLNLMTFRSVVLPQIRHQLLFICSYGPHTRTITHLTTEDATLYEKKINNVNHIYY
jgi:hypothetical protein